MVFLLVVGSLINQCAFNFATQGLTMQTLNSNEETYYY